MKYSILAALIALLISCTGKQVTPSNVPNAKETTPKQSNLEKVAKIVDNEPNLAGSKIEQKKDGTVEIQKKVTITKKTQLLQLLQIAKPFENFTLENDNLTMIYPFIPDTTTSAICQNISYDVTFSSAKKLTAKGNVTVRCYEMLCPISIYISANPYLRVEWLQNISMNVDGSARIRWDGKRIDVMSMYVLDSEDAKKPSEAQEFFENALENTANGETGVIDLKKN